MKPCVITRLLCYILLYQSGFNNKESDCLANSHESPPPFNGQLIQFYHVDCLEKLTF